MGRAGGLHWQCHPELHADSHKPGARDGLGSRPRQSEKGEGTLKETNAFCMRMASGMTPDGYSQCGTQLNEELRGWELGPSARCPFMARRGGVIDGTASVGREAGAPHSCCCPRLVRLAVGVERYKRYFLLLSHSVSSAWSKTLSHQERCGNFSNALRAPIEHMAAAGTCFREIRHPEELVDVVIMFLSWSLRKVGITSPGFRGFSCLTSMGYGMCNTPYIFKKCI